MAGDTRAVFNARRRQAAEEILALVIQKYAKTASDLADWMEECVPEGLTVFSFPEKHRRCLRPAKGLERFNHEIRRCTRVSVRIIRTI